MPHREQCTTTLRRRWKPNGGRRWDQANGTTLCSGVIQGTACGRGGFVSVSPVWLIFSFSAPFFLIKNEMGYVCFLQFFLEVTFTSSFLSNRCSKLFEFLKREGMPMGTLFCGFLLLHLSRMLVFFRQGIRPWRDRCEFCGRLLILYYTLLPFSIREVVSSFHRA